MKKKIGELLLMAASATVAALIIIVFGACYMIIPGRYGFYEPWYVALYSSVVYLIIPGSLLTVYMLRRRKWFGLGYLLLIFAVEFVGISTMNHWGMPKRQDLVWLCPKEAKSKVLSEDAGAALSVPDVKRCELAPY